MPMPISQQPISLAFLSGSQRSVQATSSVVHNPPLNAHRNAKMFNAIVRLFLQQRRVSTLPEIYIQVASLEAYAAAEYVEMWDDGDEDWYRVCFSSLIGMLQSSHAYYESERFSKRRPVGLLEERNRQREHGTARKIRSQQFTCLLHH